MSEGPADLDKQDSLIVVDRLSKYALKRQCQDSLIVVDRLSIE